MARDRIDDEYDDDRRDDDRPRRRGVAGDPERGRAALLGPAIGLILVGLIALGLTLVGLATAPPGGVNAQIAEKRQEQLKGIEDGPGDANTKKQSAEMTNNVYDFVDKLSPVFPALSVLPAVGGLVILFGGIQMIRAKSRGLGMTAAILAMIPCFASCGCVLGIPVGIWALVVLGRPDVKAAFAAGRRPALDSFDDPR